jgi:hypothetical protein
MAGGAEHARHYHDDGYVAWHVVEREDADGWSLIFYSRGAIRRVRTYPADWYLYPIAELTRLSWTR